MNEKISEKQSYHQLWLRVALTFVSQFGSGIFSFALSLFIYQETKSSISFGINMIAAPIAIVLLTPFIGKIIDGYSHKKIVVLAELGSITSLLIFLNFFNSFSEFNLLIFSFLIVMALKIADEFVLLTLFASSINFVIEKHQTKMRAYQQIAANISSVLSPVLGGLLFSLIPFIYISNIEIVTELISLIIVLMLNFKLVLQASDQKEMENDQTIENKFIPAVKWVFKQKYLRSLLIISSIINACDTILYIAPALIVLSMLHLDSFFYSIISAVMVLGELISGIIVGKRGEKDMPLAPLMKLSFITAGLMLFIGISGTLESYLGFILLALLLFLIPFLESFYNIPLQVWYVNEIPKDMQGKVFSFIGSVMMGTSPIAILLYGFLYDIKVVGLEKLNMIIILAVVLIKFGLLSYYKFIKKIDFSKAKIDKHI